MFAMFFSSLPSLFLSLSQSSFFVKALFVCFCLQNLLTTANLVLFKLDLIGYDNLIKHSIERIYFLYKLLAREQIITDINTKTNYQTTKSAPYAFNSFFFRARDCMIFTLHDLTGVYIERVTAHRIKINDHSCSNNLWPNTKTKLKHI